MAETEIKESIQHAISSFAKLDAATASEKLLNTLGYKSTKKANVNLDTLRKRAAIRKIINAEAFLDECSNAKLLFQYSDDEVKKQSSLFEAGFTDTMQSYLFFAVELKGNDYSRSQLSGITRFINRLYDIPVMLFFRYGNMLTVSVINRRLHKKDESKDVLEKVTLIKDILIPKNSNKNSHRAHIEILFDLSFDSLKEKQPFSNFEELHNAWQKTLDIKELNKKFFQELANWYFWATQKVSFPDGAEEDKDIRNATGVIRLITRIMFVWFLREKNLVSDDLFDERKLKQILKYSDKNKSTYYKAILQNLFFATLNTEMGIRKFRIKSKDPKARDGHFFIHNVFRYEDEFIKPKETLEKYFEPIPFLNGGLFECLDKEMEKPNGKRENIRIDGFSDREDNVLKVPDEIFFCEKEKTIDLSDVYGTPKKSKEKVRGLIDILSSYKFTIAENTPIEEEVALDPELLGKVFENLLANYNPETRTTARKQTGSFYTPREIVDYMVDESLIAYLKQQIKDDYITDEKLHTLLSYSVTETTFSKGEKEKLIEAIDTIKILDPACGSGAFPMGVLHKLVNVLHKLDPKNELWKQRQIDKASSIDDAPSRDAAIETIEEAFSNNELDYGRKLYLIENCIYGVDIQPIAVQISKLRFFISLIVEQRTNPERENLGVRPLPNLETKFVAANTLIALEKEKVDLFSNEELIKKKEKLKGVRHKYFEARTPKRKEKCREEDKRLREEMIDIIKEELIDFNKSIRQQIQQEENLFLMLNKELTKQTFKEEQRKKLERDLKRKAERVEELNSHLTDNTTIEQTAHKLSSWNPYDQNASATFFDMEWMYGLKDGFDVVLGNPPYIQMQKDEGKLAKELQNQRYESYERTGDVYAIFYEYGLSVLKENGLETFITSSQWMKANYGKSLRKFFLSKNPIKLIVLGPGVFESATVDTSILITQNGKNKKQLFGSVVSKREQLLDLNALLFKPMDYVTEDAWQILDIPKQRIKRIIETKGKPLSEWDVQIYRGVLTGYNEAFIIDEEMKNSLIREDSKSAEIVKPILRGREIDKYFTEWDGGYVISTFPALHMDITKYKAVKKYLEGFLPKIRQTGETFINADGVEEKTRKKTGNKWFETQDQIGYYKELSKEKIIWKRIGSQLRFSYSDKEIYCLDSTCIATGEKMKYLTGLLNSKLCHYQLIESAPRTGMGDLIISVQALEPVLVYYPSDKEEEVIVQLVDKILSAKAANPKADTSKLEKQIDDMVYELYALTRDEIDIIERT